METKEEKHCTRHAEKYAVIYGLNDYSGIIRNWTLESKGLNLESARELTVQRGLEVQHKHSDINKIFKFIKESELKNYNLSFKQ
jgi:hypothetical protein